MSPRMRTVTGRSRSGCGRPLLVSLLAVAVLTAAPVSAFAQQRRGLLDRLGDLFGGAPAEEEEVARPVPAAQPFAANGVPPSDDEVAARQKRIDTWSRAWEESLVRHLELSDEQRSQVRQLLAGQSARHQGIWKSRPQPQRGLPDTTVILFAGATGATAPIVRSVEQALPELLTDQQQEKYIEIRTTRAQRITDWFAVRAAAIVDAELFLSDTQFAACLADVRLQTARGKTNGLYGFHQQNYYLPYEQLGQFIRRFRQLELTSAQQRRWHDLRSDGRGNNNHVLVTVGADAEEENEEQLNQAYQKARKQYLNAAAVRSEFLKTSLQLPEDQARYLEVAGKGVTVRNLNSWKKRTRAQIKQFAENPRFAGGFGNQQIGLSAPAIRSFEQDRLWKRAVEKICADGQADALQQHDERILRGATAFMMATLDRELHLDDDQAAVLRKNVQEIAPHQVGDNQYYWLEIAMVARTLIRLDSERLSGVLSTAQLECLELIQSQFRYHGKDRATLTSRHGEMNLKLARPNENRRVAPAMHFFFR